MQIQYGCPYWGNESVSPDQFIQRVLKSGFDGIELYLTPNEKRTDDWMKAIEEARKIKPDFFFVLLQLNITPNETADEHISFMKKNIPLLAGLKPLFINSHTGRDFFSFDENCRVIETAENISASTGVRILHETHRSRFSFHAPTLIPYLDKFPELKLLGDLSHFTVVGESMLEHIDDILHRIFPKIEHIHARIGHEQAPQVNNPAAPEWKSHVNLFMTWWQKIIAIKKQQGHIHFTITPEFGPSPYLPSAPFTKAPLSDAYECNEYMLGLLKSTIEVGF